MLKLVLNKLNKSVRECKTLIFKISVKNKRQEYLLFVGSNRFGTLISICSSTIL